MLRGRQLAEAVAWEMGGGTHLMAGTGHVAAGSLSDRRRPDAPLLLRGEVAPARRGLRDRLSEPVQSMRRPDSCLCVRCGRRKAELARRHAGSCSNVRSLTGDRGAGTIWFDSAMPMEGKPA